VVDGEVDGAARRSRCGWGSDGGVWWAEGEAGPRRGHGRRDFFPFCEMRTRETVVQGLAEGERGG
jgi:hypothetical protein